MTERVTELSELKTSLEASSETASASEASLVRKEAAGGSDASSGGTLVLDAQGRAYATGKRKTAVARLWLRAGKGSITINGQSLADYFPKQVHALVMRPLTLVEAVGRFDVMCTVKGSGTFGQGGAVRHALSKALALYKPEVRGALKREGFLTLDSRVVERKKYGQPKARKRFQRSKR